MLFCPWIVMILPDPSIGHPQHLLYEELSMILLIVHFVFISFASHSGSGTPPIVPDANDPDEKFETERGRLISVKNNQLFPSQVRCRCGW